jgi:hypothetical protein
VSLLLHKSISFSLPAAIKVFRIKDVLRTGSYRRSFETRYERGVFKPDLSEVFLTPI